MYIYTYIVVMKAFMQEIIGGNMHYNIDKLILNMRKKSLIYTFMQVSIQ